MARDNDSHWVINGEQARSLGLSLIVVVSMIAFSVLAVSGGATGVSTAATTITVDNSGGADHTSIQTAVDNAAAGDTIEVQPGIYQESVTIDTTVTIIAPNGATLDGSTLGQSPIAFTIEGQAAPEIVGLTITGYSSGVYARGSGGDWTLRDATIQNSSFGAVRAQDSTGDWTITDSIIKDDLNDAVDAHNTTGDWTIRDSTLTSRIYAAQTTGQWLVEGVTIQNTSYAASIVARYSENAWTIRETNIKNAATSGIDASNSAGAWQVQSVTITNASRNGVGTSGASGDWVIQDSTIRNSTDAGVSASNTDGSWSIHGSTFVDNNVGVGTGTTGPTGDATRNWWGACDGPSGDFSGSGDDATGNLAVKPYYTDAARTTLSNETTSPCSSSSPFNFGVELEQTETVVQGSSATISVNPNNNADQPVSGTSVELLVDADDDGQFSNSEVVASTTADFAASEYQRINLTYTNVQLSPGTYDYMGRISKDGQTTRSFTNGTLDVISGSGTTTTLALSASVQQSGSPGGQASVDYVITNTSGQNSVTVNLTSIPNQLSINQSASQFDGATFSDDALLYFPPSGTQTATMVFDISANADATQTFTITATVEDENGTVTDTVQTEVGDVQQSPPQRYDTNNNGMIDLREVRTAINDFASGNLSLQAVRTLINHWANGTPI